MWKRLEWRSRIGLIRLRRTLKMVLASVRNPVRQVWLWLARLHWEFAATSFAPRLAGWGFAIWALFWCAAFVLAVGCGASIPAKIAFLLSAPFGLAFFFDLHLTHGFTWTEIPYTERKVRVKTPNDWDLGCNLWPQLLLGALWMLFLMPITPTFLSALQF